MPRKTNNLFFGHVTVRDSIEVVSSLRESLKSGGNVEAAKAVGKLIAERGREKGISAVVFDRGGYLYHGRIQALADSARESGLQF